MAASASLAVGAWAWMRSAVAPVVCSACTSLQGSGLLARGDSSSCAASGLATQTATSEAVGRWASMAERASRKELMVKGMDIGTGPFDLINMDKSVCLPRAGCTGARYASF